MRKVQTLDTCDSCGRVIDRNGDGMISLGYRPKGEVPMHSGGAILIVADKMKHNFSFDICCSLSCTVDYFFKIARAIDENKTGSDDNG